MKERIRWSIPRAAVSTSTKVSGHNSIMLLYSRYLRMLVVQLIHQHLNPLYLV